MRIGIVGDTHGDVRDATNVLNKMGDHKISHVFIVGDFGLWTHFAEGQLFLDEVNEAARVNNLTVFAVGGNHENWDHWNWFVENMPTHKGFAMVRRRVLLAPKVHSFTMANRKFAIAGGAVSIDKDYRLMREQGGIDEFSGKRLKGTGPKTLWWPNEELSGAEAIKACSLGTVDVLLTHDCSNYTNFHGRFKSDPESERHRRRIDDVIAATKPKVHFHGHMHTRYEWVNTLSHGDSAFIEGEWKGPQTKTYGLEANPSAQRYSASNTGDWWGILDTDTLEFAFQGK